MANNFSFKGGKNDLWVQIKSRNIEEIANTVPLLEYHTNSIKVLVVSPKICGIQIQRTKRFLK